MNEVINKLTMELFIKNPIFSIIIVLGVLSAIFYKKIAGKTGEFWVKRELSKLDKQIYYVINNVTIQDNNSTHQIDHIVISQYGIFVIETKQYNGYIYGNEYDKQWIQNRKYHINNPIHQNYGHVKCLENALNLPENNFIPIVCIPSTAKINIKAKNHIARIDNLNKIIQSYTTAIIEDSDNIYNKILSLNITDSKIKKQHIKKVKEIQKNNTNNFDSTKCPWCGGDLIKRHGKYGDFVGCTNYPNCKYTRKIGNKDIK